MRYIDLGSNASYDYKDGLKVECTITTMCSWGVMVDFDKKFDEEYGLKVGDTIEAGFHKSKAKEGTILKIWKYCPEPDECVVKAIIQKKEN